MLQWVHATFQKKVVIDLRQLRYIEVILLSDLGFIRNLNNFIYK